MSDLFDIPPDTGDRLNLEDLLEYIISLGMLVFVGSLSLETIISIIKSI